MYIDLCRLQINFAVMVSVSGILQGTINTSAANGELDFPSALNDHAGDYSLTVFTSNGSDTAAYKLIVFCKFRTFSNKILLHLQKQMSSLAVLQTHYKSGYMKSTYKIKCCSSSMDLCISSMHSLFFSGE
jgi:hypothetical protein